MSHVLLGLLEKGPRHGYALKRDYDDWFGVGRPVPSGQVYSTLARLERDGLAEFIAAEPGDGPGRRRFAITGEGIAALDSWLARDESTRQVSLGDVFTKTVVALLAGRDAEDVLASQRAAHLRRMRELRALAAGASPETVMAVDYVIAHLQADLDWIDLAAARLARREPGHDRK